MKKIQLSQYVQYVLKDNIANLSNCLFVSQEYFRDVTSLPKSAF